MKKTTKLGIIITAAVIVCGVVIGIMSFGNSTRNSREKLLEQMWQVHVSEDGQNYLAEFIHDSDLSCSIVPKDKSVKLEYPEIMGGEFHGRGLIENTKELSATTLTRGMTKTYKNETETRYVKSKQMYEFYTKAVADENSEKSYTEVYLKEDTSKYKYKPYGTTGFENTIYSVIIDNLLSYLNPAYAELADITQNMDVYEVKYKLKDLDLNKLTLYSAVTDEMDILTFYGEDVIKESIGDAQIVFTVDSKTLRVLNIDIPSFETNARQVTLYNKDNAKIDAEFVLGGSMSLSVEFYEYLTANPELPEECEELIIETAAAESVGSDNSTSEEED